MPSGLVALLDDVAALTRLAATSLDDVGVAASRAGSKAAGVVIDDAAVTPGYVTGLSPQRELPIIWAITRGSLRNKLLILLPAALLLSWLAPWAITPLLMLGGGFLCFEGAEKVVAAVRGHDGAEAETVVGDPAHLEATKVAGAIRTDLILSAEIMAIALADVADEPLLTRAVVLALVGVGITIGVYGVVALIVKMDDIGLHLAQRRAAVTRAIGRGLVRGMPLVMGALSKIGTVAMLWVGGGILLHGAQVLGWPWPAQTVHHLADAVGNGAVGWVVQAGVSAVLGLGIGAVLAGGIGPLLHRKAD
jgi:predicted DNA repair protein MutK